MIFNFQQKYSSLMKEELQEIMEYAKYLRIMYWVRLLFAGHY